jgi:hypothetical protein
MAAGPRWPGHQLSGQLVVEALAVEPAPGPEVERESGQRLQSRRPPTAGAAGGGKAVGELGLRAID